MYLTFKKVAGEWVVTFTAENGKKIVAEFNDHRVAIEFINQHILTEAKS